MPTEHQCPKCGAVLSEAAAKGLCPRCLMAAALGPTLADPGKPTIRIEPSDAEEPLERIDRYKILQKIGEGGCGVVYMAEQTEPVRRRVALKVIKLGMDTKQVIARFEAERQALALMDHPNIAKVLDAGATATGRPYFVMELVKGIRITDYCDQNQLSTADRLGLFTQVCQAIQHAHQKGIIHRDIKPSNILVTLHDGVPVPKVIDFGIAKATEQPLTEKTVFTAFGLFMGTPAYMSPEQAELSGLDIDTRSDIYALGVLLYELLTGKTPFDAKELLQGGLDEMRRRIREEEPMPPSTRLSTMADADLTEVAGQRQSEPAKLSRFIRGDLDWIVMKCLEKDRTRRYETANGLAREIERFLNDEPVVACPPSAAYRFHKMVRRNRLAFSAVIAVVVALLFGLGIATWQFLEKSRAYNRAVLAEKKSQTEASKSQQVARFLKQMLQAAGPSVARGRDATILREILEKTSARASEELKDQPEVQADIYLTIGSTFMDMGDHRRAITNLELAVKSYGLAFPGDHKHLATSLGVLGFCQSFTGDVANGNRNARLGLEMARRCGDQEILFRCLLNYASSFKSWGMGSTEAEPYERETLELKRQMGSDPVGLARVMGRYSFSATNADEGERMCREALELFRKHLPPEHPDTVQGAFNLGQILIFNGKSEDAERALREALAGFHRTHAFDHPFQPIVLRFLAEALLLQGKGDEAESVVREQVSATPTHGGHQDLLRRVVAFRRACALDAEILKNMKGDFLVQDWILNQQDKIDSFARSGRWQEAITEMAKVIEDGASNHLLFHLLAPLLVASGDAEGYRRHCERIQVQFVATRDPLVAERMAKACLILPGSGVDFQKLDQWVRIAMTADTNDSLFQYSQFLSGLAAYRQNDCTRALEILQPLLNNPRGEPYPRIEAWTVLAMANHKLNRIEEARTALTNGLDLARTKLPQIEADDLGVLWNDWVIVLALFREARTLIEGTDPGETVYKPAEAALFAARPQDRWRVHGRAGRWSEAATSLKQSIESEPNNAAPYLRLAPILLLNGGLAGYQKLCTEIVARFSGTKDIGTADTVAKTCTIHPESGVDFKVAAEAAETAVTLGRQTEYLPWFELCKSLGEYRQEHFAGAVDWAQKALAAAGQIPERDAAAYFVLALAHTRLKQPAALAAFNKGVELVEKRLPKLDGGDLGGQWVDVIIANLLMREARTLIQENGAHGDNHSKPAQP